MWRPWYFYCRVSVIQAYCEYRTCHFLWMSPSPELRTPIQVHVKKNCCNGTSDCEESDSHSSNRSDQLTFQLIFQILTFTLVQINNFQFQMHVGQTSCKFKQPCADERRKSRSRTSLQALLPVKSTKRNWFQSPSRRWTSLPSMKP